MHTVARVQTGEQKTYLATLICDLQDLEVRWEICVHLGVDGVLVAPFIQSIGLMAQLATRRQLSILQGGKRPDEILTYRTFW